MIKHTLFKYNVSLVSLFVILIIYVSCFHTINCEDYTPYIDKLTVRAMTKTSLMEGTGDCYIGTPDGNVIFIKGGKIVNYDIIYQTGITDAEIAEWSAANSSSTTTQSKTEDSTKEETSSTVENKDSNKNDSTTKNNDSENKTSKTENAKTPTYTDDEIAAAWSESERAESTCIEAGHVSYTNSLTGETKSEELPLAEHKYSEIERKDATCSEAGSITYTCEICGDTYSEEVPALGHEYEWITTKEATLFRSGEEQYVCKNCGDVTETRVLSSRFPTGFVLVVASILFVIGIGFMTYRKNKSSIS
ncbi:MAG: hypothetical protein E7272_06810 [Pseudobutyrivibrio ruminis]|uniref:Ig-like domain-containing protein n=1 Tax=Pseudobutyrivibrio ruminis TaxID=46206 RepID=A0A927UCT5_9FIRM|nr:hypothetical protein [Pseudobutyrivibrio ruminis]